ncbi:alpha/beta hydrolase [Pelagicoccus albus]|uniref:Alpha/beta hydrolase n=1 Tax=Pelagicoccus albus TaxID=415222 RepID=A0A7X1E8F6_9BACT|nr:alpha/beta hydrolase-fold protein [Pelagicoccus albus]MBC2604732.1 alpha/beta hydrolase [Pelagicoccus albus]
MFKTSKRRFLIFQIAILLGFGSSFLRADVPTSELPILVGTEIQRIESEDIGDEFYFYVRVPPEAAIDPGRSFPVIYALDGDHSYPLMSSVATQLGWSGSVPPVIIVGIGWGTLDLNGGNNRSRDLSPQPYSGAADSGGGPAFLKFLETEAFPLIEEEYPVDTDKRYLYGHSLGGLFSLYAYCEKPELFTGIVSGSPYLLGQLDFLSTAAASFEGKRDCKLVVISGDEEGKAEFLDDLEPLEKLLETTWATEGSYEITVLPGFDHFTMVAPSISMGLKSVFAE